MRISIIVVSYNTKDILRQCLQALIDSRVSSEMEIWVVDNQSADESAAMVTSDFADSVNLIANDDNKGFAAANNQAYARARGDYVVLLNPDAFVQPDAIQTSIDFMQQHSDCGICGAKLVNAEGRLDPSARRFPNCIYRFFTLSGLADRARPAWLFGRGDFKSFDHQRIRQVDWVPGTFMVLRRHMLTQIGLLDERFFIYSEETDLCLRAKRNGWKVYFIPTAQVTHIGGASSKTRDDMALETGGSQLLKFRMRSEYLYFRKNHGRLSLLLNAGVEIGWHVIRWLIHLRPGNPTSACKRRESAMRIKTGLRALWDTRMGNVSPPKPWKA